MDKTADILSFAILATLSSLTLCIIVKFIILLF